MIITAQIWDKVSPINGRDAVFLSEHFTKSNGDDDRVLIAYDGIVSRIQFVNDTEFATDEKAHMQSLINGGLSAEQAIAETWAEKARAEYEDGLHQVDSTSNEQLRADIDYLSIMMGGGIVVLGKIKGYYDNGLWSLDRVYNVVGKAIAAEEYEEITGRIYSPFGV